MVAGWCCGGHVVQTVDSSTRRSGDFYAVVHDAPVRGGVGTVHFVPGNHLAPPLRVEWKLDGVTCNPDAIGVDASGLRATRVPPHLLCAVEVVDRHARCERGHATVGVVSLPSVVAYECDPATSSTARNGSVRAVLQNAPSDKHIRYLWTNGVITETPVLDDAPEGPYAVTLLSDGDEPLPFIHACASARVTVLPRG